MKSYSDHNISKDDLDELKTLIIGNSEYTDKRLKDFFKIAYVATALVVVNLLALDAYIILPLIK